MRFFQKTNTPQFFIDDTRELQEKLKNTQNKKEKIAIWDKEYKNKKRLKKYILKEEQNYLCCYCECKIDIPKSEDEKVKCHLEHIKPKNLDLDNLTFDYSNIILSCQGNTLSECNKESSCGHSKGNKFDERLFLNPTRVKNIREYFYYDIESGEILSDRDEGKYMIKHLNLNDKLNNLPKARKDALEAFIENIPMERVIEFLNKDNLPFISFLRFHFQKFL